MLALFLAATVIRVSVATDGTEANGSSYGPAISSDGRYIVFESDASNLIQAGDNNGLPDVYLRDMQANTTECLSCLPQGGALLPEISPNGRYISYRRIEQGQGSRSIVLDRLTGVELDLGLPVVGPLANSQVAISRLVHGLPRLYLHGLRDGSEPLIWSGPRARSPWIGAVSPSAQFIGYTVYHDNGSGAGHSDAFVLDRATGTRDQVDGNGGYALTDMAVSADGRFVAYQRDFVRDIWLRDRNLGSSRFLALTNSYGSLAMSTDGRYVCWVDTQERLQVLDQVTNLVGPGPRGQHSSLTADGSIVGFDADEPLVRTDTNNRTDVYVWLR